MGVGIYGRENLYPIIGITVGMGVHGRESLYPFLGITGLLGEARQGWDWVTGQHSQSPVSCPAPGLLSWHIPPWEPGFMDLTSPLSAPATCISILKLSSFQPPSFALHLSFLLLSPLTGSVNHPCPGFPSLATNPGQAGDNPSLCSQAVFRQLKLKELVLSKGLEPACSRELHCTLEGLPNVLRLLVWLPKCFVPAFPGRNC